MTRWSGGRRGGGGGGIGGKVEWGNLGKEETGAESDGRLGGCPIERFFKKLFFFCS